jgi:RDD family.
MDMENYNVVSRDNLLGEEVKPLFIPAKNSVRLLSEMADIFMALILGVILYIAALAPAFGYDTLTAEMSKLSNTMLYESLDSSLAVQNLDGTMFSEADLVTQMENVTYYKSGDSANQEKDLLSSYYCSYRKAGTYTVYEYNTNILGLPSTLAGTNESPFFAYDARVTDPLNSLGVLSAESYSRLRDYRNGSRTAESIAFHKSLVSFYTDAYEKAFQEFRVSQPFYGYVLQMSDLIRRRSYVATGASLSSYLISTSIFFILVPFIKLKGTTLGKKIFKLDVKGTGGLSLKPWQILSRGVVEMLEYVFEVPFEAMLVFGFDTLALPLFSIGTSTVTMVALLMAGLLVTGVSTLFLIFGKRHQSFHDFASLTSIYTSDYAIIDSERAKLKAQERGQADE